METSPPSLTLELRLGAPVDNRLGLEVPGLVLAIVNTAAAEVEIPEAGLSMLLRLRTHLARGDERLTRSAGTGKPVTPKTRKLAPGDRVEVKVSPLDDGPGESPLAEGEWSVKICLDAACSNEVALPVARR